MKKWLLMVCALFVVFSPVYCEQGSDEHSLPQDSASQLEFTLDAIFMRDELLLEENTQLKKQVLQYQLTENSYTNTITKLEKSNRGLKIGCVTLTITVVSLGAIFLICNAQQR